MVWEMLNMRKGQVSMSPEPVTTKCKRCYGQMQIMQAHLDKVIVGIMTNKRLYLLRHILNVGFQCVCVGIKILHILVNKSNCSPSVIFISRESLQQFHFVQNCTNAQFIWRKIPFSQQEVFGDILLFHRWKEVMNILTKKKEIILEWVHEFAYWYKWCTFNQYPKSYLAEWLTSAQCSVSCPILKLGNPR